MPVTAINIQTPSIIQAAYRSIYFNVTAQSIFGVLPPPVCYADIYFNGTFYTTIESTRQIGVLGNTANFEFDISNVAQTYLLFNLANYPFVPGLAGAFTLQRHSSPCFVKFRSASYNALLVISPDSAVGTGITSSTFVVANMAIQHEDTRPIMNHIGLPQNRVFSHIPPTWDYPICKNDSDWVFGFNGGLYGTPTNWRAMATLNSGGPAFILASGGVGGITANATYAIGSGPQNIAPTYPWNTIKQYQFEVRIGGSWFAFRKYKMGCCCSDDKRRLFYMNYLGTIDGINFGCEVKETISVKSSQWQRTIPITDAHYVPNNPNYKRSGFNRFDIQSNETVELVTDCLESRDYMQWAKEAWDSPAAFVEKNGRYVPVVIIDSEQPVFDTQNAVVMQGKIKYIYANPKVRQRN